MNIIVGYYVDGKRKLSFELTQDGKEVAVGKDSSCDHVLADAPIDDSVKILFRYHNNVYQYYISCDKYLCMGDLLMAPNEWWNFPETASQLWLDPQNKSCLVLGDTPQVKPKEGEQSGKKPIPKIKKTGNKAKNIAPISKSRRSENLKKNSSDKPPKTSSNQQKIYIGAACLVCLIVIGFFAFGSSDKPQKQSTQNNVAGVDSPEMGNVEEVKKQQTAKANSEIKTPIKSNSEDAKHQKIFDELDDLELENSDDDNEEEIATNENPQQVAKNTEPKIKPQDPKNTEQSPEQNNENQVAEDSEKMDDIAGAFDKINELTFYAKFNEALASIANYEYQKAIIQIKELLSQISNKKLREKLNEKYEEARILKYLKDSLVREINQKKLANSDLDFKGIPGKISQADDEIFRVKIPHGETKNKWKSLSARDMYEFFCRLGSSKYSYAIGVFCFSRGLEEEGEKQFIRYIKRNPKKHSEVDKYFAEYYKLPIPEEGFVTFRGHLVTKEERDNSVKGLVKYGDSWIKPEIKKNMEEGNILVNGKWVKNDSQKLIAKGFRQFEGKWYPKKQIEKIRREWEHAWTLETKHYLIKTNTSEELLNEIGALMEAAYAEYVKYFSEDIQERMNVYCFKSHAEYRDHIKSTGVDVPDLVDAYALPVKNAVFCYHSDNIERFRMSLLHEGLHLFHYKFLFQKGIDMEISLPGWFAEGLATQFEAHTWDGKTLSLKLNDRRLTSYKGYTDLRPTDFQELTTLRRASKKTADEAAAWYATWWALFYFLEKTDNKTISRRFGELKTKMNNSDFGGKKNCFVEFFSDKEVELIKREMTRFMNRM